MTTQTRDALIGKIMRDAYLNSKRGESTVQIYRHAYKTFVAVHGISTDPDNFVESMFGDTVAPYGDDPTPDGWVVAGATEIPSETADPMMAMNFGLMVGRYPEVYPTREAAEAARLQLLQDPSLGDALIPSLMGGPQGLLPLTMLAVCRNYEALSHPMPA